jgi:hypothetical protein
MEECETGTQIFHQCLIQHKGDVDQCESARALLERCDTGLHATKGAPASASYCIDQISDYAKCSLNPNTSMCSSQYIQLHECKLRRRRFLFGDDLGLVTQDRMSRKRW